jgi:glycosyltransferase involved in cell wall biosynthesis
MNFSVIIPTKDRNEILGKTLNSLRSVSNISDLEIIIINDSEKPISINLNSFPTIIKIVQSPGKGVATARNFGASLAIYDWLVFMDDDMLVKSETFKNLIPYCNTSEKMCLNVNWVYPESVVKIRHEVPFLRYLNKYGFDSLEGWSSDILWNRTELFRANGITSQFLLFHKGLFEKLGGYNMSFPFAGFEDHDLSKRIKANDIVIYIDPQNMIFHNEEDRMKVEDWLERKKRGAITRKVAVGLGYFDLKLQYSLPKKVVYESVHVLKRPILALLNHWPKIKRLDRGYFFLVNVLLGMYSYIGYTRKD